MVIEAFTPEIKEIARAVSIWPPLARSQDALAADGLRNLRAAFREDEFAVKFGTRNAGHGRLEPSRSVRDARRRRRAAEGVCSSWR